ncbi:MAG: CPBP family intramembrane metalloprotease [Caldilineales bacterium]|nr:CPBP family intramembrane metalloprotease [Caldilineales bacterium]
MLLLVFIPILMLVILANLGQGYAWARWLTYFALLGMAAFAFVGGLAALFAPPDALAPAVDRLPPGLNADLRGFGGWLLAGGILTAVPVVAAIVATLMGKDPRIKGRPWTWPVQLTAICLAVLYTCFNLAQAALISDPSLLSDLGLEFGLSDLAAQAAGLVALALVGVGLGLRRDWRQSLARLKLSPVGGRDLSAVVVVTGLMVLGSAMVGGLITLLSPESVADADAFNQILIGAFSSPWGAVVLGLLTGISEELLYRGALQPVFGLWLTVLIFGLHHIQYLNISIIVVLLLGLTLGWVRNRWSTTTAALVHAAYNSTLVLLAVFASQAIAS